MTKRYYSKRYSKKRYTKYLIIGLILMFVVLMAASACVDIPQFEPIRKQIELFKSERTISDLYVGETGENGDLAITLVEYELTDNWIDNYDVKHKAPEGAKYLFIHIKVENIGKTRATLPTYIDFSLWYTGAKMPYSQVCWYTSLPLYIGITRKYPGYFEEGWLSFEFPAGIELDDTILNVRGLVWRMIPQPQKDIVVMDSEGNIIYEK